MSAWTLIACCSAVIAVASTNQPMQVELSAEGDMVRSGALQNSELLDLGAPAVPKELKELKSKYFTEFLKQDGDNDGDPEKSTLVQKVTGSTPTGGIQIGTAFKDMNVIFDTGSDRFIAKTWDTISHMIGKVDSGIEEYIMPTQMLYNSNTSSTYKSVLIKSKDGTKEEQSYGKISYGSGDAITKEGTDTISLAKRTLKKFPVDEIVKDSLPMLHTAEAISGVFGLMHMRNESAGTSAFSMLWAAGEMTAFGFCHGRETADEPEIVAETDVSGGSALLGGAGKQERQSMLLWGDKSTEGNKVEVVGSSHWAVKMTNFTVIKTEHIPAAHDVTKDDNFMPVLAQQAEQREGHLGLKRPVRSQPIFADGGHAAKHTGKFPSPTDIIGWFGGGDDSTGNADPTNVITTDPNDAERQFEDAGGKVEDSEVNVCADGTGCAAIIDTGSNILAMSTEVVKKLSARLGVKHDCSNLDELDDISFNLGDSLFKVSPASYVMKVKLPDYMQGQVGDMAGAEDPLSGAGGGEDPRASYGGEGGGGADSGGYIDRGSAGGGEDTAAAMKAMEDAISHWMSNKDSQGHRGQARAGSAAEKSDGQVYATHDPFHPFVSDRPSLTQEAASRRHRSRSRTGWAAAFHQLATRTGIDLRHSLGEHVPKLIESGKIGDLDSICMPAFSPMDMTTKYGPLMVLGTPLFNEYYARFSRESPEHVNAKADEKVVDQEAVETTNGQNCGKSGQPECGASKAVEAKASGGKLIEDVADGPTPQIFFKSLKDCKACQVEEMLLGGKVDKTEVVSKDVTKEKSGAVSPVPTDSTTGGTLKLAGDSKAGDSSRTLPTVAKFLEESTQVRQANSVQQKTRPKIVPREMRLDEIRMMHPSRVGWEL